MAVKSQRDASANDADEADGGLMVCAKLIIGNNATAAVSVGGEKSQGDGLRRRRKRSAGQMVRNARSQGAGDEAGRWCSARAGAVVVVDERPAVPGM